MTVVITRFITIFRDRRENLAKLRYYSNRRYYLLKVFHLYISLSWKKREKVNQLKYFYGVVLHGLDYYLRCTTYHLVAYMVHQPSFGSLYASFDTRETLNIESGLGNKTSCKASANQFKSGDYYDKFHINYFTDVWLKYSITNALAKKSELRTNQ